MSAAVYSSLAFGYDDSYAGASHRKIYDLLAWERVSAILTGTGCRVVDVGCGSGRWAQRLSDAGHHVTGIEGAPGMIAELGKRRMGDRFQLIEGRMEDALLPDGSADLVLAMGSLQYSDDPGLMLKRFAGWLRPGGSVCVYVDSLLSVVSHLLRQGDDDAAAHVARSREGSFTHGAHTAGLLLYDAGLLSRQMSEAGLVDLRIHGLGIRSSILGREAVRRDMEADETATVAIERQLSDQPELADAGLHIFATGHKPLSCR